jgi:hypothetical protein
MKINQILDKIDEKQLFVPAFQREYRWKKTNAKELISSLIRDYPTGTMLTWETNNPPELKGDWQYSKEQGSVKLILDGQQRITTLYLLIKGSIPPYYTEKDIMYDPRGLYINVKTQDLQYYKKTVMSGNPLWVDITDILQKKIRDKDIIRSLEDKEGELSREDEDTISDTIHAVSMITEHEFPEQIIPAHATLREAIDIFYIVNASGISLTEAELALAQMSGYWPTAREEFKKKLIELAEEGFVFNLDFIMYCLLGVIHSKGSDMSKLHDQENNEGIREVWKTLRDDTLDLVLNLMRDKAYIEHTKEINSVYALIPIIVFVYHRGSKNLTELDIKKFIKWFYYSQIRQRYVSQLPQKLDKDITIATQSKQPFDELLSIIEQERSLTISPNEFIGASSSNALHGLMRWYFKSKGAVCLTTGVKISQNMGKKYSLESDHIFPYSILKSLGYSMNSKYKYSLAQEITNRAVLTQVANRTKSDKQPEVYLKGVKEKFPSALSLQCIPEDENLWKLENYEDFLTARRAILASELNEYLEKITSTDFHIGEATLEDIIAEGESGELEFKSSLRWSYKEEMANKKLEVVIMKTIAAFSNSDGGTLLIGVQDDGEILGLDKDYSLLDGDADGFELHVRNLLNNFLGKVKASKIHITFPMINEVEVCRIDILKADEPVFLDIVDEGKSIKEEKFYVRSGNSSQELKMSEANEYIKKNF